MWTITKLKCLPDNPEMKIVYRIEWERDGKTGEAEVLYNPNAPFIPFDDLTENDIVGWIEAYIGEDAIADFANYVSPDLDPGCLGQLTVYNWQ